jgi:clan AA aspartic protease
MGLVMIVIKVSNNTDIDISQRGLIPAESVRSAEIEAMVDTGATMLALPEDAVRRLGVPERGRQRVRFADGRTAELPRATGIRLEILGRDMTCDALVLPAGSRALLGVIPLEGLDLMVDPKTQTLRPNPESPDEPLQLLCAIARQRSACNGQFAESG